MSLTGVGFGFLTFGAAATATLFDFVRFGATPVGAGTGAATGGSRGRSSLWLEPAPALSV